MKPLPARLDAIIDSLGVGILAFDADGRTEFQNAEASRILGISAELTAGRHPEEYLGSDHPALSLLKQALHDGNELSANACSLPHRIGSRPLIVDLTASPISGESEPAGVVLTLRDRTIGHDLEALFAQRSQSELFAQLAAGVAHEIRNPLSGIRGAAELLGGKLGDVDLQRYSSLIRDETDRIRRLLDDLAELTHGGDLHLQTVNLYLVLDNLLELQSQSPDWKQLEIRREYDPSLPELELDPDRLTQVFLNLVRNAAQAMEYNGILTVRTRIESTCYLTPEAARPVRLVSIDIEDTGPGIPEADIPHIFTPFFTRRAEGTGLGLAIAQHWTVRHGGQIQVARLPHGGTQMRVMLPARRDR